MGGKIVRKYEVEESFMKFKYEIVRVGAMPTWEIKNTETFTVPVAVGDKVKPDAIRTDLMTVVAVEHYPGVSVLYVESASVGK